MVAISTLAHRLKIALIIGVLCTLHVAQARATDASQSPLPKPVSADPLLEKGRMVALAADCAACHRSADASAIPFVGGYAIQSPMGPIYASNITPSKAFGIGNYSEAEFAAALRQGQRRDGTNLYPAMTYTAYKDMTDADMHALYSYLMQVVPAQDIKGPETRLDFPFNQRWAIGLWNGLFLQKPETGGDGTEIARGKYLVNALGHCSSCHTPRNFFMAEKSSAYLAGASIGGWYAPNLTSDAESGLGNWTVEQIVQFLKTGTVPKLAQAGGGMAEAVEHSLQYLPDADLWAMAVYLKQVPAKAGSPNSEARADRKPPATLSSFEPGGLDEPGSYLKAETTDGALLYNSACASCHQLSAQGTPDAFYPSLMQNTAVGTTKPDNLVMTILQGIDRKASGNHAFMPAFDSDLTNAQIAAVATYILQTAKYSTLSVTEAQVKELRNGGKPPLLVTLGRAWWLFAEVLAVAVLLLVSLIVLNRSKAKERQSTIKP